MPPFCPRGAFRGWDPYIQSRWGEPIGGGVITVLRRATKWLDQQQESRIELNGEVQIARNDKGIAHVVNDLSNPRLCDPKAGALPGCATPRLRKYHSLCVVQVPKNPCFATGCKKCRSGGLCHGFPLYRNTRGVSRHRGMCNSTKMSNVMRTNAISN